MMCGSNDISSAADAAIKRLIALRNGLPAVANPLTSAAAAAAAGLWWRKRQY